MKFLAKLGLMAIEIFVAYLVAFVSLMLGFAVLGKIFDKWENRGEKTRDPEIEDAQDVEDIEEPVQEGEIVTE